MAATAMKAALEKLSRCLRAEEEAGRTDGELLEAFLSRRDEGAFEALLLRHGPMVLGVCRRVLGNDADAEDAFQATFLILARKAGSIRPRSMVGNWLHGVAHTTALKARAMNIRRATKEREAAARPGPSPEVSMETWERLQERLDQELRLLPDIYRSVIVLCDLEGMTIKEAARQLGCPQGTAGTRLARGRELLSRRLARHGVSWSAGAIATVIAQATAAGVPPLLVGSTMKAAAVIAAGQAAASGVISAKVAALTEGTLKTMLLTKLKIVTAVVLMTAMVSIVAWGVGSALAIGGPPAKQSARARAPAGKKEIEEKQPAKTTKERQVLHELSAPARTASPKVPAQPRAAPTPDQQVAELVEAYRALPAAAKLEAEGDRIIERLHMVRGKLSPRSQEAVARLEASHTLRGLAQALQKNDQESLKNLVSKQKERETFAERLKEVLPYLEPSPRRWEYKTLAESYVEKLGEGELAAGLGQLGEDGWELAGLAKGQFVFKRQK